MSEADTDTDKGRSGCQLYLLSPVKCAPSAFAEDLRRALDTGPVAAVQLRLAGANDDDWKQAVEILRPIAEDFGVAFLLDDRPDLVAALGADGVHLSGRGMSLKDARTLLGEERMIGVFCRNSKHFGMVAAEEGADYVSFGPFFGDISAWYPKENYAQKYVASAELVSWWRELIETPCVAAGGLTPENCGALVAAGADFLCVSSAVWTHAGGPAAAVRAFHAVLARKS